MKHSLQKRTSELEELRAGNTENLEKNKATLVKLQNEIMLGETRELAIANRIDEIALLLNAIEEEQENSEVVNEADSFEDSAFCGAID